MRFICFALLTILAFSCSNSNTERINLIDFVPENSSVIVKTTNVETLKSSLNNSDFLQKFTNAPGTKLLKTQLKNLSLIKSKGDLLLCFSKDNKDSLQYTLITKYQTDLFKRDSLKNYMEETLKTDEATITKSTFEKTVFYSAVIDSTFLVSSSKTIIEAAFSNSNKDAELNKIFQTTSNDKTLSIIIKADNPFVKSLFKEKSLNLKTFTSYIALDAEINQNEFVFDGITTATDSTKSIINVFKNTIPQENQIQKVVPSNSDGFLSFTFNDFEILKTNLNAFKKRDSLEANLNLFSNITEVGVLYQDKNRAIILNSIDVIETEDAISNEQTILETFRQVNIYNFSEPHLFKDTFYPLVTFENANKYCVLDNYFVFSDTIEILQNVISNYQNQTTINETDAFNNIKGNLSNAASMLLVANPTTLNTIINSNFNAPLNLNLDFYNTSAVQFIYDGYFAHIHGIIKKNKVKAVKNAITEILNIKLDSDILNNPQLVTNHITNEKEIVVQDIKNNLYLISNKGKVLWKKQINAPILGEISQIDIYKNGRLQLAFATPNAIFVIDRNGNDVAPFPLQFKDNVTQPLSVFDYDKNKNYRLLLTQENSTLMYDTSGKIVKGYSFKADSKIISQPKHFRIGSKDYIVLKTANKVHILDRTGKTRVTPKASYSYSSEPIFLHNNLFTTTGIQGDIISIEASGNTASKKINLPEKHHITASSKTLVTLGENKLTIKGKTIELDYGNYTKPELFYIKDKNYVALTDLQTQKVYIFDSLGQLLPNFPVYGTSVIALDQINKDQDLEFITKGESNSILIYQIN
ncbi:hypothetical protein [Siansivirga zeaxanthinifaciens]|uniref:Ribonuclease HII n=1 Tax=Siansivirga zeaxanthinifaciens CC-SAMT-1 TaxID=1454006 RepID=A0A0C5WI02_9FLAO|nr:hypothetical protein [Siansivirga zeaxanthinifaciens]AJR02320.1 ribonuclease HII [Siansivirga zeaxanthinifaciens CC-SAMT-1]